MTDKEKQIEEMAKIISSLCDMPYCDTCYAYKEYNGCTERKNAEKLYSAGYRKQREVVKEFVAGVTVELNKRRDSELYGKDSILGIINKVAAGYGVEVEK